MEQAYQPVGRAAPEKDCDMLQYKAIEIFTGEEARWRGKPLSDAIVQFVCNLKIAARCMVTRGIHGCYESGEIATQKLEILSWIHRVTTKGW